MLLFDSSKIYNATGGIVFQMYLVLKMLTFKEIPTSRYDKIYKYSKMDFSGESFLLHPDVLMYNRHKHSYREIAQYLALAAMRSLAEYEATGKITLDLFVVDIDPEILNQNSLLRIEDDTIHFIYEEVKKENIH